MGSGGVPAYSKERFLSKKTDLMEKCYDCFAENGLSGTGIRALGKHCGCNPAVLYTYFDDLDDLIVQSTEHCMSKVEDDFMAKAPQSFEELERFIDEVPYWTAKKHGKKYRLMYQVYTHPKYIEHGKKFFEGVNQRYTDYAKSLEDKIGIPYDLTTPLIFVLIRACVHYAMFEDEFYLQTQIRVLKDGIRLFMEKHDKDIAAGKADGEIDDGDVAAVDVGDDVRADAQG